MGIIGTIVVYVVLAFCNTISSGMLIDTKKYCETHVRYAFFPFIQPSRYPQKHIDSDYARIIYHVRLRVRLHSSF